MKKLIFKLAGSEVQDSPTTVSSSLGPDRPPRSSVASPILSSSLDSTGSSESGSAPKRPRFTLPWTLKTPSLPSRRLPSISSKPVIQKSAKPSKPVRQVLSELGSASVNEGPLTQAKGDKKGRRHSSIAVPAPSRGLDENGDTYLENQSFTDGDIFTSTTHEHLDVSYDGISHHGHEDDTTVGISK